MMGDMMEKDIQFSVSRESLDKDYVILKTWSEKSSSYDFRQLAMILMRWIEESRGDEIKTELPSRHHK
jgi:hypothetical protein